MLVSEVQSRLPIDVPNVHCADNLAVLSFVGSTGSTTISFILPGFVSSCAQHMVHSTVHSTDNHSQFYFRLFRSQAGNTKWAALALGIYGVAVMTFCLTFNIIHLGKGGRAGH